MLLASVISLHAFDPAEFEDETRLGFRGNSEIMTASSRVSGGKSYEHVQFQLSDDS